MLERIGRLPAYWLILGATVLGVGCCGLLYTTGRCEIFLGREGMLYGCNYAGRDLSGTEFTDAELAGANFQGANLRNTDFYGADVTGADFSDAILGGISFGRTRLDGANFSGVDFRRVSLGAFVHFSDNDLSGANLSGMDLTEVEFNGSDLREVAMVATDLTGVNLRGLNLAGADLQDATLSSASLFEADLSGANLSGAALDDANLVNADLSGADVTGATFDGALLTGVSGLTAEMVDSLGSWQGAMWETRDSILASVGVVCQGDAYAEAVPFDPGSPMLHPTVLATDDGGPHAYTYEIPDEWWPARARQVELVVCLEDEEERVLEVCDYIGGPDVTRLGYRLYGRVVEAQSGATLDELLLSGTPPRGCRQTESRDLTELRGERVSLSVLMEMLEPYVNPTGESPPLTP